MMTLEKYIVEDNLMVVGTELAGILVCLKMQEQGEKFWRQGSEENLILELKESCEGMTGIVSA